MKTIGIIGGMSWESTQEYYKFLNEDVRERLGGLHSAQCLIYSFDFAEVETLQQQGKWDEATTMMVAAAKKLEQGGADFIIVSSNTMHRMAPEVEAATTLPFLHIADPTAGLIKKQGIKKVGLLGTKYTMEQDFYKGRLVERHGLEVVVPDEAGRQTVNAIIYEELCMGEIRDDSRQKYLAIIESLKKQGAEAVILGCTEIGLLVKPEDTDLPVFDTARIHAEAAVSLALS